jgi:hypothetical protein
MPEDRRQKSEELMAALLPAFHYRQSLAATLIAVVICVFCPLAGRRLRIPSPERRRALALLVQMRG